MNWTMRYLIFIVIGITFLFVDASFAQNKGPKDPMDEGAVFIGFGVGPAVQYYSGFSAGFGPGFEASFEKGMWQLGPGVLTLGAEMGFSYFAYNGDEWYGNNHGFYKYSWFTTVGAVRSAYHYGWDVRGLDTYGGIGAGMRILFFNDTYDGYSSTYNPARFYPFIGMFFGASYFFNDLIGINGEVGYNINYAQIGMTFKLR
jgi:hypothetical protein